MNAIDNNEYIVFVDESGSTNLKDKGSKFFVLAFCIFKKHSYINNLNIAFLNFKFEKFGHDNAILHYRHGAIVNDKKDLFNQNTKDQLRNNIFDIISNQKFEIIMTVIDKTKIFCTTCPYDMSLTFCLERLHLSLKNAKNINIIIEARGHKENNKLEEKFKSICNGDNHLKTKFNFQLIFVNKKVNHNGLQIADYIASETFRQYSHPKTKNRNRNNIIKSKLRKCNGKYLGYGLKVFPKE
ncbi:MAG TPA: DUF3800 domain-containing protein [Burkholderiales bacterium]|nr:DUF3800 domain-containing protein [Burkholderiales bacterium]